MLYVIVFFQIKLGLINMRIIYFLMLLNTLVFSVELSLNKSYEGPVKLTVSSLGINMGVPSRWQAIAESSKGLKLSQKKSEDVMVLRAKELSINEVANYLSAPHYLQNNIKIFPEGRIVTINSRIYRRLYAVTGGQGREAVLIYVILGPQNRAVTMRIVYDKSHDSSIKATSMNIVQSLSFTPTKQLSSRRSIEARLKGLHVSYMQRDGAYDDKRELWLCSNKRYMILEERTVAGGMSRMHEKKLGQWFFENSHLILRADDGLERLIKIELKDKALLFDGIRSFELKNHTCQ